MYNHAVDNALSENVSHTHTHVQYMEMVAYEYKDFYLRRVVGGDDTFTLCFMHSCVLNVLQ